MSRFPRKVRRVLIAGIVATLLLAAGGLASGTDGSSEKAAKVAVESTVPATVIVDGRLVGPTPQWLALVPGNHRVEVSAPNHRAFSEAISVSSGEVLILNPDLEPVDPQASIIVSSQGSLPRPQWSPDGSTLAMVCDWERVFTYTVSDSELTELAHHTVAELALVGWSADGKTIAYEEFNGPGQWLVSQSGKKTAVNSSQRRRVRWAPGLEGALVTDASGLSWYGPTGSGAQPPAGTGMTLATGPVSDAQVSSDGRFAIVVEPVEERPEQLTMHGNVNLIDLGSGGRRVVPEMGPCEDLARASFSRQGQFLTTVNKETPDSSTYGLTVVDLAAGSTTVVDQIGLQDAFSYDWSPQDEWLVYAIADRNEICLWNSRTGVASRLDLNVTNPANQAFLGDRSIIICDRGSPEDRFNVDLWILPVRMDGRDVIAAGAPRQIASDVFEPSVAVSPTGDAVAFATSDGVVWIWQR